MCSGEQITGQVYGPIDHWQTTVADSQLCKPMFCRCAQACQAREIDFLDAPISGGPQKARDGKLTIMCGGMQKVYDKVEPIMKTMGSHVRLMGGHGAGTATNLVSLLITWVPMFWLRAPVFHPSQAFCVIFAVECTLGMPQEIKITYCDCCR